MNDIILYESYVCCFIPMFPLRCGVPSANDLLWQNANNMRIAIRRNTIVVYVVEHDSSCSKLPRENLSKRYNRLSCIHMPSRNFKRTNEKSKSTKCHRRNNNNNIEICSRQIVELENCVLLRAFVVLNVYWPHHVVCSLHSHTRTRHSNSSRLAPPPPSPQLSHPPTSTSECECECVCKVMRNEHMNE